MTKKTKYLVEKIVERELADLGYTLGPRIGQQDIRMAAEVNKSILEGRVRRNLEGYTDFFASFMGEEFRRIRLDRLVSIYSDFLDSNHMDSEGDLKFRRRGLAGPVLLEYKYKHPAQTKKIPQQGHEVLDIDVLRESDQDLIKKLDYASDTKSYHLGFMLRDSKGKIDVWLGHEDDSYPEGPQITEQMRINLEALKSLDSRVVSSKELSRALSQFIRCSHNIKVMEDF